MKALVVIVSMLGESPQFLHYAFVLRMIEMLTERHFNLQQIFIYFSPNNIKLNRIR